jgi:hypothetical protein
MRPGARFSGALQDATVYIHQEISVQGKLGEWKQYALLVQYAFLCLIPCLRSVLLRDGEGIYLLVY